MLAIGAFAGDLLSHAHNEASHGFGYFSINPKALKGTKATHTNVTTIINFWKHAGLIETTKGFQRRIEFDDGASCRESRSVRYRATDALLSMFREHSLTPENARSHFKPDLSTAEVLVLRSKRMRKGNKSIGGDLIPFEATHRTTQLANEIREINACLENHSFAPMDPPWFRRTFNEGTKKGYRWDKGGRLTVPGDEGYQRWKPEKRLTIKIDGSPIVEMDVKASHMSIFYGLIGKPWNTSKDPYDIPGMDRSFVKKMVIRIFGIGELPKKWPKGMKQEYAELMELDVQKTPPISEIIARITEVHPDMISLKRLGIYWAALQYLESTAIIQTMLELVRKHDIPSLPVHDSLIVPIEFASLTESLLINSYQKHCGCNISVVPRYSD
ncbi:hypothetical protein [Amaricoccus tamworthensis]|uniref:hypothetical protein n=1 Tax=Amaricoccus tamworthensis TaxID=57002 RepID=UPI003C7B9DCA